MTPDKFTNQEFFLDVGDGHQLYVQDWGNKDAKTPIIFLHGGPGGGVKDGYKATFEPTMQRVIFFDQRGSGKSLPYGSLEHNTTDELVEDIEQLADHLKLTKFVITGGSWGSCLALMYALKHPERIEAMVLRGIFTGSKQESDWVDTGRFRDFFPELWEKLLENTPPEHRKEPVAYHMKRMLGGDEAAAKESAYHYGNLEAALLKLDDRFRPADFETYDPTMAKIEAYYFTNSCFIPDSYILKQARALTMPIWLVQGRYDMVCPPITAYKLHQALPHSQLIWTTAGHSNDRANYDVMRTLLLQLAGEQ